MAKRIMRAFKMTEISAVDRPAQEGARMVIMKRHDTNDDVADLTEADLHKMIDKAMAPLTASIDDLTKDIALATTTAKSLAQRATSDGLTDEARQAYYERLRQIEAENGELDRTEVPEDETLEERVQRIHADAARRREKDGIMKDFTKTDDKLDALAKEYAKANKVAYAKAMDEVLKTDEGKALYAEYQRASPTGRAGEDISKASGTVDIILDGLAKRYANEHKVPLPKAMDEVLKTDEGRGLYAAMIASRRDGARLSGTFD